MPSFVIAPDGDTIAIDEEDHDDARGISKHIFLLRMGDFSFMQLIMSPSLLIKTEQQQWWIPHGG